MEERTKKLKKGNEMNTPYGITKEGMDFLEYNGKFIPMRKGSPCNRPEKYLRKNNLTLDEYDERVERSKQDFDWTNFRNQYGVELDS